MDGDGEFINYMRSTLLFVLTMMLVFLLAVDLFYFMYHVFTMFN